MAPFEPRGAARPDSSRSTPSWEPQPVADELRTAWAASAAEASRPAPPGGARSYQLRAKRRESRGVLSNALLAVGFLFVLLGGGTVAYAQWADWQHRARQPVGPREALAPSLAAPTAGPSRGVAADPAAPVAAPQDPAGKPVWITIPRINVDSSIMAMSVQDGEYQVPSFDVGHHADSANPGAPGNSVFNGHLETIDAGRVFARLHQLAANDAVYVYTATHRYDWVVQEVRTVPNTDTGFIRPTTDMRITLYTCAGSYDPRTRDYSHRLVVVGKLVQVGPRGADDPGAGVRR